jgi:phosphopentomutase
MARAIVLILDSVGIGGAPDASHYADEGADTVGHIAEACARGEVHRSRSGILHLPHLVRLGLGEACRLATGRTPSGLENLSDFEGTFGCAAEISKGKDTPSGHWELAGVPVLFDWGYFPREEPCFPSELIETLCRIAEIPGILGNCHASGTEIIALLGAEHIRTGKPICYTSADSVFQIAAHESYFGLRRLYEVCKVARSIVDPINIGRVIARPFTGEPSGGFVRTANRRDFSVPPPSPTILDKATRAGRDVITVGKIADIFAHSGTGRVLKGDGNLNLLECTLSGMRNLADGGLLFANFIDFDTIYGHRRDVAGYAKALEDFDSSIPRIRSSLRQEDIVIVTADHGCDPTWPGTDHTREQVPILLFGPAVSPNCIGQRKTFSDASKIVSRHLGL